MLIYCFLINCYNSRISPFNLFLKTNIFMSSINVYYRKLIPESFVPKIIIRMSEYIWSTIEKSTGENIYQIFMIMNLHDKYQVQSNLFKEDRNKQFICIFYFQYYFSEFNIKNRSYFPQISLDMKQLQFPIIIERICHFQHRLSYS